MSGPLVAASRAALARGSRSFAAAARLFDAPTRQSVYLLYAWCRHCDDAIDGQVLGHGREAIAPNERRRRLADLEARTRSALRGEPSDVAAFEGLRLVAARHAIPAAHPLALVHGFRMDVEGREYRTLDDTLDYAYHVAGVVGVMMAMVMGAAGEDVLDRASDLGLALQLTNIARDVVDDAHAGRVYLPSAWLDEAGVPASRLTDPRCRREVASVTRRLLIAAEPYYASALHGLPHLGFRSAWAVATARSVYREIGEEVIRRGPNAWDDRTVVPNRRKAWRALEAALTSIRSRAPGAVAARRGLWTRPRTQE